MERSSNALCFDRFRNKLFVRARGYLSRKAASGLACRPAVMRNTGPLISFTFDDFPRSALLCGGSILEDHGIAATYYASFGLMGRTEPTGEIFNRNDLQRLFDGGHEIGCHTFSHCHAWNTPAAVFEESVLRNREALQELAPFCNLESLSFPISCPRPGTKRRVSKYFGGCRGGGQTYNAARVDLNNLQAFFVEQSLGRLEPISSMVEATVSANGWLILATHDVSEDPTRYGCTPKFFREIVQISAKSGARVLPVAKALREIKAPNLG